MYGKLLIQCELVVRTGLHIGGSNSFSAIGAVNNPVVRDPSTGRPIIPGSSLKGKLRTLLARSLSGSSENLPSWNEDSPEVRRLFGSSEPPKHARLQFSDAFVSNADEMKAVGLTEVKMENSINRATAVANPRPLERVTTGTRFEVKIVYDIENDQEVKDDLTLLAKAMRLLQLDYLGGHGSRGSGRVSLCNFTISTFETDMDTKDLLDLFREVENYELFPV